MSDSSESKENLTQILKLLSEPKGLKPEAFAQALQLVREMTFDDMKEFMAVDASRGTSGSVENEMLRGVIQKVLSDAGIDVSTIKSKTDAEVKSVSIAGSEFSIYVVAPDKTTRAREDISLADDKALSALGVSAKFFTGSYQRRVSSGPSELPCKLIGLCFTDRVGMPMFLSSFKIRLSQSDVVDHGIRNAIIPVSEKSFKTSPENWKEILLIMEAVSSGRYNQEKACVRDFFYDSLSSGELFITAEKVSKLDQQFTDREIAAGVQSTGSKRSRGR